ncbi:MAG: hypothetical protein ACR2GY_07020 [Phycisphaerales bacterium]
MSQRSSPFVIFESLRQGPAGSATRVVVGQPSWVRRFAILTFLLVVGLPILLLLCIGLLAAAIVFFLLSGVNAILSALGLGPERAVTRHHQQPGSPTAGRENVRVIVRE